MACCFKGLCCVFGRPPWTFAAFHIRIQHHGHILRRAFPPIPRLHVSSDPPTRGGGGGGEGGGGGRGRRGGLDCLWEAPSVVPQKWSFPAALSPTALSAQIPPTPTFHFLLREAVGEGWFGWQLGKVLEKRCQLVPGFLAIRACGSTLGQENPIGFGCISCCWFSARNEGMTHFSTIPYGL